MATPVQRPPEISEFKFKSIYDFEDLIDKKFFEFSAKPVDLSERFADEMENTFDFKNHVSLEFNKLQGYPKKISGFTGQLRDWWDNYMTLEQKVTVINATSSSDGVDNLGVCTQEGINLCNELKLSRQLKIDKLRERSQLGDFCTQFGLSGTSVDSKKTKHRDSRGSNPNKPYRKRRSKHRHISKEEQDEIKAYRKSNRFAKNRSKRELAKIKCYKCGNFGHIAPNCKLEKLKALEIDEEVHDKVYSFLYTSGSESDYDSDSSSEEEIEFPESSDNN
ncbi:hypothetical protein H5410_046051 [Solanum commersonii]|uniref:CCHC-type domain-containing protein n=1 Tax=Solanum commersonii TaxID=4109 RepID=A0A9J5XB83_SOLCO|nr:hypothetical protein H5410_046051 [Solanum commersonii]